MYTQPVVRFKDDNKPRDFSVQYSVSVVTIRIYMVERAVRARLLITSYRWMLMHGIHSGIVGFRMAHSYPHVPLDRR